MKKQSYAGFFGSREWTDPAPIKAALESLPRHTIIITGDADGADALTFDLASELGFVVLVATANWNYLGNAAGPRRNIPIADISDRGFAFGFLDEADPDPNNRKGKGTRNCLGYFKELGKDVVVHRIGRPVLPQRRYKRRLPI